MYKDNAHEQKYYVISTLPIGAFLIFGLNVRYVSTFNVLIPNTAAFYCLL